MLYVGFLIDSFLFFASIFNIVLGVKRLHVLKAQGQPLTWYKQVSIDLGCMCLLLSLFYMLVGPINLATHNGVSDAVGYTAIVVLGIPIIVFCVLLFKYRTLPQNQSPKTTIQEKN